MTFLSGEYDHQIDAKNRIRIPAKLKGAEEKLYFSKGISGCISVNYIKEMDEKLTRLQESVSFTDSDNQRGLRQYIYSIKQVEMDQQGRFVIPPELIAYAKINKDIKICGLGSSIEIWAIERYEEYMSGKAITDPEVVRFDTAMSNLGKV